MPDRSRWTSVAAWLLVAATASADPAPPAAAAPGDESGQTVGDDEGGAGTGTEIARGALFIPKILFEVVMLPVRGGVWVYDRYQLDQLYYRTFYNAGRTFGIIPTIAYSTGLGLTVGAELTAKNTFGEHEHLTIAGTYGGTYHTRESAWLDSGTRFDPVVLSIGGNFERFDPLPFYGIGNADLGARPAMLVDPRARGTAFRADYRYQELRARLGADVRLLDGLHLIGSVAVTDLKSSAPANGTSVGDIFDPAAVVGFDQTFKHVYGELEVRWDRRGVARPPWETTTYTKGWLMRAFAGRVHELDVGSDFTHYGGEIQALVHLGLGPRMLIFRLWGEGVTGTLDSVPFTELPLLGGDLLRGYDYARFRDRVSALGTAQYLWDLSAYSDAFLFVDAGRVYSSPDAFTFKDMRVGYGVGVTLHSRTDFILSGTLASSIDGGLFVTASLTPLLDETPRWR